MKNALCRQSTLYKRLLGPVTYPFPSLPYYLLNSENLLKVDLAALYSSSMCCINFRSLFPESAKINLLIHLISILLLLTCLRKQHIE